MTPLHLAVKQVETAGHTRLIRFLLVKGASRDSLDRDGRRPVDYTAYIEDPLLKKEAINSLRMPSWHAEFLMLRTPLKKLSKNFKGVIAYLVLFWVAFTLKMTVIGFSSESLFWTISLIFVLD